MSPLITAFSGEIRRIITLRPVFSVIVIAVIIYSVFYPQPYLNEALRDVPIAVVDLDGTQSSRELARLVDATPDVSVALVLPDVVTAEREVYARKIFGILVVPQYFERDLLHGRASPIALYADASYFLMYQRMAGAISSVARTLGTQVDTSRLVALGVGPSTAAAATDPLQLTSVPLFNPQGGYATYVLPAALVLILQQTLLIGVGLLGTLPGTRAAASTNGAPYSRVHRATMSVFGKLLAYLAVEALIVPSYLIGLPYLYGIPRLGSVMTILAVALPFVLAVGSLGMIIAAALRKPLIIQLVFAAIGLPFFFLAGFAWPTEAMPQLVRMFAILVPSTLAIDAFVNVGQLGASLADVRNGFIGLWLLAGIYTTIAILLELARIQPEAPPSVGATKAVT